VSKPPVIVDTGPLVALLVKTERHHAWVCGQFETLSAPLLTCDAVLSETFFLLSHVGGGTRSFFDLLESGLLKTGFNVLEERAALRKLVQKYADLPMSLADACLVRMAELNDGAEVFTLDHHFGIYRKNGRQQIPSIMPKS
jgi:predicted nucleic acid-binding protein